MRPCMILLKFYSSTIYANYGPTSNMHQFDLSSVCVGESQCGDPIGKVLVILRIPDSYDTKIGNICNLYTITYSVLNSSCFAWHPYEKQELFKTE